MITLERLHNLLRLRFSRAVCWFLLIDRSSYVQVYSSWHKLLKWDDERESNDHWNHTRDDYRNQGWAQGLSVRLP